MSAPLPDNRKSRESYERAMQRLASLLGESRGDGFEMFLNLEQEIEKLHTTTPMSEETASHLRLFKIMTIAVIEGARVEIEAYRRPTQNVVSELVGIAAQCTAHLLVCAFNEQGLRSRVPRAMVKHYEACLRRTIDDMLADEHRFEAP